MSIQNLLLIACTAVLISGCAVIKDTPQNDLIHLEKSDFKKLNATVSNCPADGSAEIKRDTEAKQMGCIPGYEPASFWSEVAWVGNRNKHPQNQTITLEFVSHKKAIVKLWENGVQQKRTKIRGNFKNGYFYSRRSFGVIPFIPFLWGYSTSRYRIGLTTANTIVVDNTWNEGIAMLLPAGMSGGGNRRGQSHQAFKKQ